MLAVKSTSGRIAVLSGLSGELLSDFQNEVDGEGSNVLYSACGQYLIDGTWRGRLSVRRADSGAREFAIDFPGEMICNVHRCVRSGRWVVAHGPKATTHDQPPLPDYFSIWQWPFRAGHYALSTFKIPSARSSSLSPDGQFIAVVHGAPPNTLSIFNLTGGGCVASVEVQVGGTGGALAWSPDGQQIASVQDGAVRVYNFPGMEQTHEAFLEYPSDVAFSPEGSSLALGSWAVGWLLPTETVNMTPNTSLKRRPRKRGTA